MHPQNHLNDLIDESHQPLKNKTDISLIKILEVRGEWKEAHVGRKKKFKYKRQHDIAGWGQPSGSEVIWFLVLILPLICHVIWGQH